jgi:hypothetical protein
MSLSLPAALVLRDRTNTDPLQVLALALDALVADGIWQAGRGWRRLRRARTLAPRHAAPASDAAEPLVAVDALLRRAVADHGAPLGAAEAGAWCAVHAERVVEHLARLTLDDLIARDLLARDETRLTPTRAGQDALATAAPPAAVRPSAHDALARADALAALSPLARDALEAYRAALGGHFPPGSVGSRIKRDLPTGGDNRTAAWRTGTGTY